MIFSLLMNDKNKQSNIIDIIVSFLVLLGFNKVKIQWKLINIKQKFEHIKFKIDQKLLHITYSHKAIKNN